MNEPRLSSTAKKLNLFVKVLQGLTVLCAVAVVYLFLVQPQTPGTDLSPKPPELLHLVNITWFRTNLKYSTAPDHLRWYFGFYCIMVGIYFAALLKGFGCIRRILSPMAKGEPFHGETAPLFRKLANCSLVFGLAHNAAEAVESPAFLFLGAGSAAPFTYSVSWAPGFGFLVVYAIFLLMSCIFSYGRELQTLSDETL